MSVYRKLQEARIKLQNTALKKSGKNKFAGYEYFELGDFLPAIQNICEEHGLCGVISYTHEEATLRIYDVDDPLSNITFSSPMSSASLKGCHDVQNLGAVQTYLRRYLWTNAFEIVEHDALDMANDPVATEKEKAKPALAVVPKEPAKKEVMTGEAGEAFRMRVTYEPEGDPYEWLDLVSDAAHLALTLVKKEEDIMSIFRTNKVIFDKAKEIDKIAFELIMTQFTEAKTKFKGV
jgi:hypothetical protein